MLTKLPCGCKHNDTHWLERCAACQAEDDVVSARWAYQRANPFPITVHRINGKVQDIYQEVAAKILQETPACPEPTPELTSGSDTTTPAPSEQPTDYSALLNML